MSFQVGSVTIRVIVPSALAVWGQRMGWEDSREMGPSSDINIKTTSFKRGIELNDFGNVILRKPDSGHFLGGNKVNRSGSSAARIGFVLRPAKRFGGG